MRVPFNQSTDPATVTLPNGAVYRATVMQTAEERAQGMQDRSSLAPDEVMLFIHPVGTRRHIYHMRNVVVSLDMVRLDGFGRVTQIETAKAGSTQPFDDVGRVRAAFMVEAAAGWAMQNGLNVGDRVIIRLP
jgi:uncharacterized membrane protein (UPF0127 family)